MNFYEKLFLSSALLTTLCIPDLQAMQSDDLTESERVRKAALRGSGGYSELRRDVLKHLARERNQIGSVAEQALALISS